MFDVICAGQAVIDCIIRGKEEKPYKENVFRAETIALHTGGDAVNESRALSSMGINTAAVCGLGNDIAGNLIMTELKAAGVSTERIRRPDIATPVTNLIVATDGSRVSVNSNAAMLTGYTIEPDDIRDARVVSFASLFRPPLNDPENIRTLIKAAKHQGSTVCADTKLPLTDPVNIEELSDVLPLIDYIFPNEKEAAYYTGKETYSEMACTLRSYGIKKRHHKNRSRRMLRKQYRRGIQNHRHTCRKCGRHDRRRG